jgi:hypothetical protein
MIAGSSQSALDGNVFVLNKHYMALRVVSTRRVFSLLAHELAEVVCCGFRPLRLQGAYFTTIVFVLLLFCGSAQSGDLFSDTWVATDAIGRELPGYADCGPPRPSKYVGVFYFLWLGQHGTTGPWDITWILQQPAPKPWGPVGVFHHWGQPELGYYLSNDEYVIRKHAQMLADAGVDTLIFDVTNSYPYTSNYLLLCSIYAQIRSKGGQTPQICFMTWTSSPDTVKQLYDSFYSQNLYSELWFQWQGKPLIFGKRDDPMANGSQLPQNIKDFFTWRKCWAWSAGQDSWTWMDFYPQAYGWHTSGVPEELSVSVAQQESYMSYPTAHGRSYHGGSEPSAKDYSGRNFAEQWNRALQVDPAFIFITGWNEWVAQRFVDDSGNTRFVDEYTEEFSRDIEPMKDGHTDDYYYQMAANIRKYKGVRQLPAAESARTINIDGDFGDWNDVTATYYDARGDTGHRDWPGWGSLHYTNTTGRNDFVTSKVAHDAYQIYFYVETAEPMTPYSDPYWMQLFIDADRNHSTGWEGYDYRINGRVGQTVTSLEYTADGWNWRKVANLSYKATGNKMEIAVPRILISQYNKKSIAFDFHWADNIQQANDINQFSINGDSAPNRRFNYRYEKDTHGYEYYFETVGDFEGWSLHHSLGNGVVTGGSLRCDVTGSDPYIINWTPINIDAATYRYLHIRMKNATSANTAEFYWTTQADGQMAEDKAVRFGIVPNDNSFRDYWVDLSLYSKWIGTIKLIRFDPTTASSGHVDIDMIRIQDRQVRCDDLGYLMADITGPTAQPDCCVNIYDMAVMAENWLSSESMVDFTGVGGIPDSMVSGYDFAFLAKQWMNCAQP